MKIFDQEKRDGIAEIIKSQASVKYQSVAKLIEIPTLDVNLLRAIAAANRDQIDLHYLNTILVSTGWNKNDDVFLADQVWSARNTPEDKPFNYMHDEKDIIGHITGSYVVDFQGNVIANDSPVAPQEFEIVTESVLYKHWNDADLQERMTKIIAEIGDDAWYVSMECLFSGFNYALVSPEGESILLQRNESTASLTKHLRAYGGLGEYQGYKVGRALSDLSFSGKGLVSQPANPRSIILRSSAFDLSEKDFTDENIFTKGDNQMSDVLEKQVAELKNELAVANQKFEKVTKDAESAKAKEIESVIQDKDKTIANLNEKFETVSKEIETLKAELAKKTEELAAAQEQVKAAELAQKTTARVSKLVSAGFSEEEAAAEVADYSDLNDASFDKVVAKFDFFKKKGDKTDEEKKKDAEASDEEMKKKKDAEEDKKKKEAEAKEADDKKKKEGSEATTVLFDKTKADNVVNPVEDENGMEAARASVANWMHKILSVDTK